MLVILLMSMIALVLSMRVTSSGTAVPRMDLLGPILEEGMDDDAYVAHKVLPPLPVEKQFGAIPSFLETDDQLLSIKHAPKTGYPRIQSKLSEKTFRCEESGIEEPLSVEDYDILGRDRAEALVARKLKHIVLRQRDIALASVVMSAAGETLFANQITNAGTSGIAWDNTSGVPLTDLADADEGIAKRLGMGGNSLLIGYGALTKLRKNAQIRSAVRNILGVNNKDAVNIKIPMSTLATVLGVEDIIVGGGTKNSADEGQAQSKGFIWPSTYALLFRKSQAKADAMEAGLGRTFVWDQAQAVGDWATGSVDALLSMILEQYRDEPVSSDILRAREYIDMVMLNVKAGQLITNC